MGIVSALRLSTTSRKPWGDVGPRTSLDFVQWDSARHTPILIFDFLLAAGSGCVAIGLDFDVHDAVDLIKVPDFQQPAVGPRHLGLEWSCTTFLAHLRHSSGKPEFCPSPLRKLYRI